jgi:sugar transferase (PEP-CTERM/EpsH1 system associated)
MDPRALVLHVVYRFDTGGLENGIVNLINHMPVRAYRHAVLSLTDVTDFRHRIEHKDVQFFELHKSPGHGIKLYPRLYRLFRRLRPAVVHTRNLAALEAVVPAWAAGVPVRIHGEHGRDMHDLDGSSTRYQRMRRLYRPFVHHYVALSGDLARYLTDKVRVPAAKVSQVCNGVDVQRFRPAGSQPQPIAGCPFDPGVHWIIGTVGRMQAVKDQPTLARAFLRMLQREPSLRTRVRLVMVGEGPLRAQAQALLDEGGVADLAWLPGERTDVSAVMQGLHCFVLPSLAEGISNTILEAMASELPVVATNVGGNAELVRHGHTGEIVPSGDPEALAGSLLHLAMDPALAQRMGRAARDDAEQRLSLQTMVAAYQRLYDQLLARSVAAS